MNNMKDFKIELKWALIYSGVTLIWLMIERYFGLHDEHLDKQLRFMVILGVLYLCIYYLGLRDKKVNFYHGLISFKEGLKFALVMSLIVAVLSFFVQFIFVKIISPDYLSNMANYMVKVGRFTKQGAEEFYSVGNQLKNSAYTNLVIGVFFGAISAALHKNKANV